MAIQGLAREAGALRSNTLRSLGDKQTHGRGRTGEIRVGKIDTDAAGGSADRQAVVDQVRNVSGTAAANDLGAKQAGFALP